MRLDIPGQQLMTLDAGRGRRRTFSARRWAQIVIRATGLAHVVHAADQLIPTDAASLGEGAQIDEDRDLDRPQRSARARRLEVEQGGL
jgi:hypothetical protein